MSALVVERRAGGLAIDRTTRRAEILRSGIPGPPGPAGAAGSTIVTATAAVAISGHQAVKLFNGVATPVSPADIAADTIAGVTVAAAGAGGSVAVQLGGVLDEPLWAWAEGPVWLAPGGALTQVLPTSGAVVRLGVALAPTRLMIDPRLVARL